MERFSDLCDGDKWHDLLRTADYVLWMAALRDHSATAADTDRQNVAPLRSAIAVLQESRQLRRFVYTSSVSAVDQPEHPLPPRPISDRQAPHPCTPYGHSKLMAESALAVSGLPHTILRLPFMYGPGFRRASFLDFYRRVATNALLSAVRYTADLSLLYTGDVADLVLEVLSECNAAAANKSPYVLSDGHVYHVDDLISFVASLHGRDRPSRRVPAAVSSAASAAALSSRALLRAGPVRRGNALLLATYWSHAAFSSAYFAVDSSRFQSAFPDCVYTPIDIGLTRSYIGVAHPDTTLTR